MQEAAQIQNLVLPMMPGATPQVMQMTQASLSSLSAGLQRLPAPGSWPIPIRPWTSPQVQRVGHVAHDNQLGALQCGPRP